MKRTSAVLIEPERFVIEEDNLDCPQDAVIVKIEACGLCMSDVPVFRNGPPAGPMRLGHQGSGTVVATGPDVTALSEGDRVTGVISEAFSDYAVARVKNLVRVPKKIPLEHALGDMLKSCVTAVRLAAPLSGDTIMVSGCGAMGLAVAAALVSPAFDLIAVDSNSDKLDMARRIGCTHTVLRDDPDIRSKIREITDGRGVDICLEVTGESEPFQLSAWTLVPGRGKMVVLCIRGTESTYDVGAMMHGAIHYTSHPGHTPDQTDDLLRALRLLNKGIFPMDALITHRYALAGIQQAFTELIERPTGYIKGIVCSG